MLSPWSCQTPLSAVRVRTYSHCDLVTGVTCHRPGLVSAHRYLLESACIVPVILSEASHAIALVLSQPTISCQSPRVKLPESCQRLLMLSP